MVDRLRQFRAMGLALALDDFGRGPVSLACLKTADIDFLKIDRSLVGDRGRDDAGQGLCVALIGLAQRLGLKVVAEGVETASQRDLLRAAGCDYAQGYFFSRALPAGQMDRLLAAQPAA